MDCNESGRIIEIVFRLKSGDQQAYEALYEYTHNRVYFLALKVVRNHEDALEVVQETYLSVYKSIYKLEKFEMFNAWLSKIVINKCKDCLGRRRDVLLTENEEFEDKAANEAIEDTSGNFIPHEVLDRSETRNMIMSLIDTLPDAQRTTLLLYYYQGLSVEEIAAIMECPAATVKSRLIYARSRIKTGVDGYEARGVKLYNIAVVPLIIFMLEEFSKNNVIGPATAAKILTAVGSGVHTASATAVQTSAGVTKLSLMQKIAAMSLHTKIAAGVVAVAVAVTAVVTPIAVIANNNSPAGFGVFSKTSAVNTVGNTPGNIANGSHVALQGDWIIIEMLTTTAVSTRLGRTGPGKQS